MINERYIADLLVTSTDPLGVYVTTDQANSLDMSVIKYYLGPRYLLLVDAVDFGYMLRTEQIA